MELSPSPMNRIYLTPCTCSACMKPSRMMSISIPEEDASQILQCWCWSFGISCAYAGQYLYGTPICSSFPVCWPMITATQVWQCMRVLVWSLTPSTIYNYCDFAGTPWWKSPLSFASLFSSLPASSIDSLIFSCYHSPISHSVWTKVFLTRTGTPRTLMVSSK